MISVFVIVKKNYRRAIAYTVLNKVGKMTKEVYIQILKELGGDLKGTIETATVKRSHVYSLTSLGILSCSSTKRIRLSLI